MVCSGRGKHRQHFYLCLFHRNSAEKTDRCQKHGEKLFWYVSSTSIPLIKNRSQEKEVAYFCQNFFPLPPNQILNADFDRVGFGLLCSPWVSVWWAPQGMLPYALSTFSCLELQARLHTQSSHRNRPFSVLPASSSRHCGWIWRTLSS